MTWFPDRSAILNALRQVRVHFPDTTLYAELSGTGMTFREYNTSKWLGTLRPDGGVSVGKPRSSRR